MVKVQNTKVKNKNIAEKNPLETLRDLGGSTARKTADSFAKIGGGMLDQFFGENPQEDEYFGPDFDLNKEVKAKAKKQEVKVFNYQEYYETTLIKKQIQE